ncbi:1,2-phenylacetyl-CoA epoxidase subunit PaaE [Methylobacterium platani]|uniref:Phenylacetic acid degradation protein n=2 Tax=Methylobacterium platani TaxID=427683 RepID=A0A179SID8_9HYPH|nr:1,2-phenylacetyl-CoA epoxidase subunit PaaE [Methylobacterium platani]KMO14777.1 phenylacetic acid degradation protein [Methylobacterium platani JCM 14648]OAS27229.1 phenylacetic acid degradation protein [Methylobacterium platani]
MTPRFHRLRVADIRRETPDAVSIAFAVPEEAREAFGFACGQYLTLKATVEGEEVRRSYSICSGVGETELRVAIKRVEGGLFSGFANETIAPGDEIEVMPPMGRFGVEIRPDEARTFVGFAAGSGITPILSIIRTVLAAEPRSRFFLFYGNRATGSILFREALESLKDRFLDRLSVFHVLSRETQDLSVLNGRLDGEKAALFLRNIVPAALVDHAFVCGPGEMIDAVEGALLGLGLPRERVHVERFTVERFTPAEPGRTRAARPVSTSAAPAALATVITDGIATEVPVAEGEAVLDAAIRAGLDLPYSCRGGMCCTCRAKVVDGSVAMEVNYSLEPWEVEAGFVLTCQARPTSGRVTVDFDQV